MKLTNKTGFTLIELLVVITIIGILATGATTVYTSQIQKARDSNRITDIKALQGGVEQYYSDVSEYPDGDNFGTGGVNSQGAGVGGVQVYVPTLPSDPKHEQGCNSVNATNNSICGYVYAVTDDLNGITYGAYEISTAFENTGNITSKAESIADNGDDDSRYEIGTQLGTTDSTWDEDLATLTSRVVGTDDSVDGDTKLIINGAALAF